jgi:hypothetical protein
MGAGGKERGNCPHPWVFEKKKSKLKKELYYMLIIKLKTFKNSSSLLITVWRSLKC